MQRETGSWRIAFLGTTSQARLQFDGLLSKGEFSLSTTSQALRASSPGRKDSLRPEGDVANSDRGRTATGGSVAIVLDEQSLLESETVGLRC